MHRCPKIWKSKTYQTLAMFHMHYNDIIMGAMAPQITRLTIVYPTVYSGANQRKRQSFASLAFVLGIHQWRVNSPHKWPVTRQMYPFNDVIMEYWEQAVAYAHSYNIIRILLTSLCEAWHLPSDPATFITCHQVRYQLIEAEWHIYALVN